MASAVGAAVHGVSDDAHVGNGVLVVATVEHVPAGGTVLLLQWLGCWGNLTYLLSSNWNWGFRRCGKLKHWGAALGGVGNAWKYVRDATIAVRAVLLSPWILRHLSRWLMPPELLLLLYCGLLSKWSGPDPLLLVHGLDPL